MLSRMCIRLAALTLLAAGTAEAQPPQLNAARNPMADLTWSLFTLAGARTTLEPFRGQVLVINSWATWCEPCVAELRSMAALRAAVPDSGVVFALVASQRAAPVAAFVRRRALQLPVYLEASPAPAVYRFEAVPTTWVIDRGGRIVLRQRGAVHWDTPEMRSLLRSLLADTLARNPGDGRS